MTDQHRATPEQWEHVQICAGMKQQVPWATAACLLELRDRIAALEAAQLEQAESHRFCTDAIVRRVEALEAAHEATAMAELRAASAEAQPAGGLVERVALALDNSCPDDEYVINDCRAAIREVAAHLEKHNPFFVLDTPIEHDVWEAAAKMLLSEASAEVRPAASEIFPVEYADSNGDGIRIIMEPADETGRACWVVRNSRRVSPIREFPTPEAAYAAHQARAEDEADHG
jgi:hypothetical protein